MAANRPRLVILLLAIVAALAVTAFMTLGARGSWDFVLKFRGLKLAGLVLVAYAVAVSTVMFQTVTANRILTPSVMGFDALYVLIQTLLVAGIGSHAAAVLNPNLLFAAKVMLMVVFSGLLFRWLFLGEERSLHLLVLVGIIFGVFFRSVSTLIQRMLDPNEFMVLSDSLFASFNSVQPTLLGASAVLIGLASIVGYLMLNRLDVLTLGRPMSIGLGLPYKQTVAIILAIVALLVSVSTALVGPVTFFGLLVASLAHVMTGSAKHRHVLPVAVLLAVICLVGGQTVLERVFGFNTALSVIIEFLGGIAFILLIIRRGAR
ncbi:enterobactin ABC transporter permease [Haematobacter massiliensis]|uniref:Enterobactin ABC transporter permease n=1 Tax=Haematobacter massiliensis TaxID=195105 RepID=A0A086Y8A9_9RHOB|nr:iron chelate uptake ABC transporter family permease subunit [Haematobacter massiliensis]KFI30509.1 enterobactin ABC transporter permease [Haematobacter massiliensis]OWJ69278.1 enterobactin ABC transporter permease [Haematobacter massiliensis]OWJ81340.1 enterobactin ABC transporter permease [Haematobacter massiliensis]QBJ24976.1 enterobactin ABC transporter permease [Haematobacter massiliensis]